MPYRLLFIILIVAAFSFAKAPEANPVYTPQADPYQLCQALEKTLPKNLSALKKLGKLLDEKISPTSSYGHGCSEISDGCNEHLLKFQGLELDLLVSKEDASLLAISISSPKWMLIEKIHIGQSLDYLDDHFGVNLPRNYSPITVSGDCIPLTLWHRKGKVTKIFLDCQACN